MEAKKRPDVRTRSVQVLSWMTPEEAAALDQYAARRAWSRSETLRQLLRKATKLDKSAPSAQETRELVGTGR